MVAPLLAFFLLYLELTQLPLDLGLSAFAGWKSLDLLGEKFDGIVELSNMGLDDGVLKGFFFHFFEMRDEAGVGSEDIPGDKLFLLF